MMKFDIDFVVELQRKQHKEDIRETFSKNY